MLMPAAAVLQLPRMSIGGPATIALGSEVAADDRCKKIFNSKTFQYKKRFALFETFL